MRRRTKITGRYLQSGTSKVLGVDLQWNYPCPVGIHGYVMRDVITMHWNLDLDLIRELGSGI